MRDYNAALEQRKAAMPLPWKRRFWARVRKSPKCWEWKVCAEGSRPLFSYAGKKWTAARFLWTKLYGVIQEGFNVLHSCDNPRCVRPSHLYLGTQKQNMVDMMRRGRRRTRILTPDDVKRLRRLRKEGWKYRELRDEFRIGMTTVSKILRGRLWAHLQEGERQCH